MTCAGRIAGNRPSSHLCEPLEGRALLAAYLVADLTPGNGGSAPSDMIDVNGTLYFAADDGARGAELWKYDPATGAAFVKDIRPGRAGSAVRMMGHVGGRLIFAADDGITGRELWASDGTDAGTVPLKDVFPGPTGGIASDTPAVELGRRSLAIGDTLFFAAAAGPTTGTELWKTDGTPQGTVLVKDIAPATLEGSRPRNMVELNGVLLFQADAGQDGRSLWRSDGTDAGTYRIGTPNTAFQSLTVSGGFAFFTHLGGSVRLFRSDGTTQGTGALRDFPGRIRELIDLNGSLFVSVDMAGDPADQGDLWRVYHLPVLAVEVARRLDLAHCGPAGLTAVGGRLFFTAIAAEAGAVPDGQELYVSDGAPETTPGSTGRVIDLSPGPGGSFPTGITDLGGGRAAFFADADGTGTAAARQLWATDGTAEGTVQLTNVPGGVPEQAAPTRAGGRLYFRAARGGAGVELWQTDGTPAGTGPAADINRVPHSTNPLPGAEVGQGPEATYYFVADPAALVAPTVSGLYQTDGTLAGTRKAAGVPRPDVHWPGFTRLGDTLYFTAPGTPAEPGAGRVWRIDDPAAGPQLVDAGALVGRYIPY